MEENKRIPCTLCGKNTEKRIMYLPKDSIIQKYDVNLK